MGDISPAAQRAMPRLRVNPDFAALNPGYELLTPPACGEGTMWRSRRDKYGSTSSKSAVDDARLHSGYARFILKIGGERVLKSVPCSRRF
jgi:hypothetical protein